MDNQNAIEHQINDFIRYLDQRVENHKKDRISAMERGNADHADRIDAARNETEHIANAFCFAFGMKEKVKY